MKMNSTFCKLFHPRYYFIYWEVPNNILLFLAEQISLMPFYYVQDVYQKNQLGTRLVNKDRHDPRSKHDLKKSKPSKRQ